MINHIETITVLKCREPDKNATKEFVEEDDGAIVKRSYGAGIFFNHEEIPVNNLDDLSNVLTTLMTEPQKFVIRGKPKPNAKSTVKRRIHEPDAAFDPVPRQYVMLDIDKEKCPEHFDANKNREECIQWILERLPEPFRTASCFCIFSSSQNVPEKEGEKPPSTISVHIWFWLDRPLSEAELKRYFKANPSPVDLALFSPVQPHYTASPIFKGMGDPLPNRSMMIKGETDVVTLPEIPELEQRKAVQRPDKAPKVKQTNRDKAQGLLLPYYQDGTRDRFTGAIAGALYRGGWEAEDTAGYILQLAEAAKDPEAMSRYDSAMRICNAIDHDRPAQGTPTLRDEFDIEELDEILTLLGVGKPDVASHIAKLTKESEHSKIEVVIRLLLSLPKSEQAFAMNEIHKKTDQPKGLLNQILKAVTQEENAKEAGDIPVRLLERLLEDHYEGGRLLLKTKDGNYWHYNGKLWEVEQENAIKKKLLPIAQELYHPLNGMGVAPMINAALSLLEGRVYIQDDPLRLTSAPPPVINCNNGEVWFDENGNVSFKPHKPESYLRNCLDVDYDPAATCKKFDTAVLDIFGESTDPEDMFRHFMEIMGYICQPWRKLAIILLFYGGGSNGKTSLLSIIQKILGPNGFMSDRMSEIEKNIFKIGALDGKLMLVDDDIDASTCLPDGFLKKISEEKPMTGQYKYGPSFEFTCRTVPTMLANHYPTMKDTTEGIRRRIMTVPFMRRFTKEESVPGLFDAIWAEEASGILNQMIAGFQRLKKRGHFTEPKDCQKAKAEWIVRSNVLVGFVEDHCHQGPEHDQRCGDFYEIFREYCERAGVKKVPTLQGVKNRLESMGYDITVLNGYKQIRGLRAPGFKDIDKAVEEASDAKSFDELVGETSDSKSTSTH